MTSVDFLSLPEQDPNPDREEYNDNDMPYFSADDVDWCFLNGGDIVCSKCQMYKICADGKPV